MTPESVLADVAAFSIQIGLIVLVVAALLKVVDIPARARYAALRLVLLACLTLPWVLRSESVIPASPETPEPAGVLASLHHKGTAPSDSTSQTDGTSRPDARHDVPWSLLGAVVLLAGVAGRALWLAVGVARLRRLTQRAVVVESPEYQAAQEQLGTSAVIKQVDPLAQPVTFGHHRPVVLLPEALKSAPAPLRRAVVIHELLHVRRGDWLAVLAEEAVRTVLWFHPAILWLTSHIQLAREELVDELTVQATGDRRTYMRALLAFAETGSAQPAPAFAHRRQLFHRILSVSKEKVMSAPRMMFSIGLVVVAVATASWYASAAFPIVVAAPVELLSGERFASEQTKAIAQNPVRIVADSGSGVQRTAAAARQDVVYEVTPENPIPRRIRGVSPANPSQAGPPVDRVVNTLVRIGGDGAVTNVFFGGCSLHIDGRLIDGEATCSPFFDAAAAAIRQWRYDRPVRAPLQFTVVVTFRPGADPAVTQSGTDWQAYQRETQTALNVLAGDTQDAREVMKRQLVEAATRLREIERAQRLAIESGAANQDLIKAHEELARLNDQMAQQQRSLNQSSELAETAARLAQAEQTLRAARAAQEAERAEQRPLVSPSGRTPIRLAGSLAVKQPTPTKRVNPEHPLVARQARVSGTVLVEALVDEQGRVADARVLRSIPMLDQAALDAAKQWEFTPTLLNGQPVPVIVQIEMQFTVQ